MIEYHQILPTFCCLPRFRLYQIKKTRNNYLSTGRKSTDLYPDDSDVFQGIFIFFRVKRGKIDNPRENIRI